jgi:hypothetical protein
VFIQQVIGYRAHRVAGIFFYHTVSGTGALILVIED